MTLRPRGCSMRGMRLALAAVAALSVFAAGCGGVEGEPNLAKAVERTEATGSFAMEMTALGTENGEAVDASCDGAFDRVRKRSRFACAGDPVYVFEMIVIGDTTYIKGWSPSASEKWAKVPSDAEDPFEELSPESLLGLLRSASQETARVGEEDVRGEATVRYTLTVDCERAEIVECDEETTAVDVWIDDDGLVRRIRMDQLALVVNVEFFDFGIPVDVEPPPADQVQELPEPDPPGPCAADEAKPIRVEQAMQALRRHRFAMTRDDAGCSGSVVSNISSFPEDDDDLDEAFAQGVVMCFVLNHPADEPGSVMSSAFLGDEQPVVKERTFENLDCSLFAYEANVDEALARLDDALAELKQAIRP